ncbi:ubiquinone biosynthesis hydroxylase [Vitreoscilla sp. C1]|uniref:FAD-dependent monooxygenase n=1 Tax=Vitreoscilla sp. (strain C1) TaxID=96942 RepID=UPI000CF4D561|nr:FAD-dependent monooxygenase [Vitreoscilla sp. C1]AUZ05543.2 ubiquinone biosynthesis hydroxylase [Vitreoscilla sp. C1]
MMLPLHVPVIIVGAGPVGMLLSLQLQQQGQQILLLEARPKAVPPQDKRTLALSYNSVMAFQDAGVNLANTAMTAISQVHISQQNAYGRTLLSHTDLNLPFMGQVIDYAQLMRASMQALDAQNVPSHWGMAVSNVQTLSSWAQVTLADGTQITCDWLILAEGGELTAQIPHLNPTQYNYHQHAYITTAYFDQAQNGVAYERFAQAGPFALLPYGEHYRLIWTRTPSEAQRLAHLPFADFKQEFDSAFGTRAGELLAVDEAIQFPLALKQLQSVTSGRVICIGNAAQTMHPVAAQGLNLGVRDAQALAQAFQNTTQMKNGQLGQTYARSRRLDAKTIVGFTHSLVTVFDQPHAFLQVGRGAIMSVLNTSLPLRQKFSEHLIFGL